MNKPMVIRHTRKGKIVFNPGKSLPYTIWVGQGSAARVVKFFETETEAVYYFTHMANNGDLKGSPSIKEEDTEDQAQAPEFVRQFSSN